MSNYYGNPLILDTPWTVNTIPAQLKPPAGIGDNVNVRNSPIMIKRMIWHNPTVGGTVLITDINSNTIFEYTLQQGALLDTDIVLWRDDQPALKLKMGGWVLAELGAFVGSPPTYGALIVYY